MVQISLETYSVLAPHLVNVSYFPGKPHRKRRGIQDQLPAETHRNQSQQEPHHALTSHPGGALLQCLDLGLQLVQDSTRTILNLLDLELQKPSWVLLLTKINAKPIKKSLFEYKITLINKNV